MTIEDLLNFLAGNWNTFIKAPLIFFVFFIAALGIAYSLCKWRYDGIIENYKSTIETYVTRLQLKDDEILYYTKHSKQEYKIELQKDEKVVLKEKALTFVADFRAYINEFRELDNKTQNEYWNKLTLENIEAEKQKIWNESTQKYNNISQKRESVYNTKYKAEAILLRDELLARLNISKHNEQLMSRYEFPTNYFGLEEIATDIELMAKKL